MSRYSVDIGGGGTIKKNTADDPTDETACDYYVLTALTNGDYYTATGGTGTALNAGDTITSTQTIYV